MADYIDIPTGLRVPTQIPLDAKTHCQTLEEVIDLGSDNNKVYSFYAGMLRYCLETNSLYVWIESNDTYPAGLLESNYLYADGSITPSYDYSNKYFNFYNFMDIWLSNNGYCRCGEGGNMTFKFRATVTGFTDNQFTDFEGGFMPEVFQTLPDKPYFVKYKINVFYTEDITTLYSDIYIYSSLDGGETFTNEIEHLSVSNTLPAYPGEFEPEPIELLQAQEIPLNTVLKILIKTGREDIFEVYTDEKLFMFI